MSLALLGRGVRPPRRRPGPDLPAPRERARTGRRARQGLRTPLDAQRDGRGARRREDVEVARQRAFAVRRCSSRADPRAYRLLVLQSHYRAPIEVTAATLGDAESALGRLDALSGRLAEAAAADAGASEPRRRLAEAGAEVRSAFVEQMNDDLDTPGRDSRPLRRHPPGQRRLRRPRGRPGAELARAVLECFAAVGLERSGRGRDSGVGARARASPRLGSGGAGFRRRRHASRRDRRARLRRRGHPGGTRIRR